MQRLAHGLPGQAPRITTRFADDEVVRLDRVTRRQGITRSDFIRAAIAARLDAEESPAQAS
ncbi:MAG: ribbon-helix-helix protein, CopG family [Frankiaceae bacterium]